MKQLIKALLVVAATIVAMFTLTGALIALGRPCRVDEMHRVLVLGFSIPPAIAFFASWYLRSRKFWFSASLTCVLWTLIALILAVALRDVFGTYERARQKLAMAQIRDLAAPYEDKRQSGELKPSLVDGPLDPWGHPFRIVVTTQRYVIVSCSECGGAFDRSDPFTYPSGATTSFNSDIVFSDGVFIAYPEGVRK